MSGPTGRRSDAAVSSSLAGSRHLRRRAMSLYAVSTRTPLLRATMARWRLRRAAGSASSSRACLAAKCANSCRIHASALELHVVQPWAKLCGYGTGAAPTLAFTLHHMWRGGERRAQRTETRRRTQPDNRLLSTPMSLGRNPGRYAEVSRTVAVQPVRRAKERRRCATGGRSGKEGSNNWGIEGGGCTKGLL